MKRIIDDIAAQIALGSVGIGILFLGLSLDFYIISRLAVVGSGVAMAILAAFQGKS